jgi:hypothetical protein
MAAKAHSSQTRLQFHERVVNLRVVNKSTKKKNDKLTVRPTDRPQRDAYMQRASNKKNWVDKAHDLLQAASFLKPLVEKIYRSWKKEQGISSELPDGQSTQTPITRQGIVEVYMMLVGCAFENLLKGAYVRRLTRGQKENRILEPELAEQLKTHNVLSLAQKLQLDLNPLEINLLKRLKETIVWRGRYPVPIEHTQITTFMRYTNDLATVEGLVAKLKKPMRRPNA